MEITQELQESAHSDAITIAPLMSQIEKRQKSVAVETYGRTQPLRDCVSDIVFNESSTPDELTHVQGELRRLSRLVKSVVKTRTQENNIETN